MAAIYYKTLILTIFLCIFKVNSKSLGNDSTDWESIASKALENDVLFPNGMNDVEFFNAVPTNSLVWPNGIVYYAIDSGFPKPSLITALLNQMSTSIGLNSTGNNCIRFTPRTTQTNYLYYLAGTGGCTSYVGMIGGQQNISLGSGCVYNGTIIHETMHGLGFYHEHNREDRDTYVTVNLQNVNTAYQYNFRKLTSAQERLYASFDLTSVMIYGNYAFSNDGQKTIVANNGQTLYDAYTKYALTSLNIQAIRGLYNCTYPTNATTTTPSTTTTTSTTTSTTTTTTTTTTTAAPTTTTKATTTTTTKTVAPTTTKATATTTLTSTLTTEKPIITTTIPNTTTTTKQTTTNTTSPTITTTKSTTTTTTKPTTTTTTTAAPTTTTKATTTIETPLFMCSKEGYFANPTNCTIFYRCVGSGTTFTKYQFTCGTIGTVFSNNQQSCIKGSTSKCPQ